MNGIILNPIVAAPVVALLAAIFAILTIRIYISVGRTIEGWRNMLLLFFRLAGIALLALLLLQPSRQETVAPPNLERVTLIGLDTSLSMKQPDVEQTARLDAGRNHLIAANAVGKDGVVANPRLRMFEFSADATPISKSILELAAAGKTTQLNKSVLTMLNTPIARESANALVLLTDGHDFELVNPAKTGAAARARQVPIYAVALGKHGKVRDVSTHITSFQPYCYVKQKARITAGLRLIGCEFEDLTVQLLRQGQLTQTKRVNAGEVQELPVQFEIVEPEKGQYEYEVRVAPLANEANLENNSAITYLNVIDQQVRVLVLEGDPYWDTTFLQRSLMRNDKFNVDSLISYGKNHLRAIRKVEGNAKLRVPETLDQFGEYDVVILGRQLEALLGPEQTGMLDRYVKERSGAVIFARGRAFEKDAAASELQPVLWGEDPRARVRLGVTAEGRSLPALRTLNESDGGIDALPELLNARNASDAKALASTLATATNREQGVDTPAIVHRRYGTGQVVSVGVEGLWRWGLNATVDGSNTTFDRFWDQMILWLLSGRDFIPTHQFSFRLNSANILLGEKAHFRLRMRQPDPTVKSVPLTVYFGDSEAGRVNMIAAEVDTDRLTAEYLPERVGRYRAVAKFPDGTTQESRFIVFTENLEETEVMTDIGGLRRLCESSGGRVIEPAELSRLLNELNNEKADTTRKTRLRPLWNSPWVFYLAGMLFGFDWYLRRRWGLC